MKSVQHFEFSNYLPKVQKLVGKQRELPYKLCNTSCYDKVKIIQQNFKSNLINKIYVFKQSKGIFFIDIGIKPIRLLDMIKEDGRELHEHFYNSLTYNNLKNFKDDLKGNVISIIINIKRSYNTHVIHIFL